MQAFYIMFCCLTTPRNIRVASKDIEYGQSSVRGTCTKILIREPFSKKVESLFIIWQRPWSQAWSDTRNSARSHCIEVEMCAEYHAVEEGRIELERGYP